MVKVAPTASTVGAGVYVGAIVGRGVVGAMVGASVVGAIVGAAVGVVVGDKVPERFTVQDPAPEPDNTSTPLGASIDHSQPDDHVDPMIVMTACPSLGVHHWGRRDGSGNLEEGRWKLNYFSCNSPRRSQANLIPYT